MALRDSTRRIAGIHRLTIAFGALIASHAALVGQAAPARQRSESTERFSFNTVCTIARDLAAGTEPSRASRTAAVPASLAALDYDAYRSIRFQRDRAIWAADGLPFRLEFFHRGYRFTDPVTIHLVENGVSKRVRFAPDLFQYDGGKPDGLNDAGQLDFAGIRVLHPLNAPGRFDELITFLGASYFRFLGRDQIYGISARGAAIDIGLHRAEEFPRFTQLWIERPAKNAESLVVHALLESPSATGAFRFRITPGVETVVAVNARVHIRQTITKLALAPLTSMFLRGESDAGRDDDFRPEIHDSDGVLVAAKSTESPRWHWRPLENPRGAQTTDLGPVHGSFGLLQRDRDFDHYRDLEAHYHRRPSVLVRNFRARVVAPVERSITPRVELLEFATRDETNDNVGAYAVVDPTPIAGSVVDAHYELVSTLRDPSRGYRAVATYTLPSKAMTRVLIDFTTHVARPEGRDLIARVTPANARAPQVVVEPHPDRRAWRVFFDLPRSVVSGTTVQLFRGDEPVSEIVRLP